MVHAEGDELGFQSTSATSDYRHLSCLPMLQVRAAAYSALCAYPLELLQQIEAEVPLSNYINPLLTEGVHIPERGVQMSVSAPELDSHAASIQQVNDQEVLRHAESLALMGLNHEYANRRRFMAAVPICAAHAGIVLSNESECMYE